jgi:SAM-dependent methyltransferase
MVRTPEERFSDRAEDYRRFRPDYPREVTDEILSHFKFVSRLVTAVDVGAGTGISSRLLASAGWSVIAVEPNAEMRNVLEASGVQSIDVRAGTAESTGLSDQCADLVTSFQAFHWFDRPNALKEFYRILRPRGGVALVWNVRSQSDPFTREYSRVVEKNAEADVRDRLIRKENSGMDLLVSPLFDSGTKVVLVHYQELDLASLIGRVRSVSYLPKEGAEYNQVVDELQRLYLKWVSRGTVRLIYDVVLYLARRRV